MTAQIIDISTRRPPAVSNPAPSFTPAAAAPAANDRRREIFQLVITPGGRREYATPHGLACRLNGRWFVARPGVRPTAVTNPELIAALNANEAAS